jgi:hypothetical protein
LNFCFDLFSTFRDTKPLDEASLDIHIREATQLIELLQANMEHSVNKINIFVSNHTHIINIYNTEKTHETLYTNLFEISKLYFYFFDFIFFAVLLFVC